MSEQLETLKKLTPGYIIAFFATSGSAFSFLKGMLEEEPNNIFPIFYTWALIATLIALMILIVYLSDIRTKIPAERNWMEITSVIVASTIYIIHHGFLLLDRELVILTILVPILVWILTFLVSFSGKPLNICVDARDNDGNYIKFNVKEGAITLPPQVNPKTALLYFKKSILEEVYINNAYTHTPPQDGDNKGIIEKQNDWKINYYIADDNYIYVYLEEFLNFAFRHERWVWKKYHVCPDRQDFSEAEKKDKITLFSITHVDEKEAKIAQYKNEFLEAEDELKQKLNNKIYNLQDK